MRFLEGQIKTATYPDIKEGVFRKYESETGNHLYPASENNGNQRYNFHIGTILHCKRNMAKNV